MSPYPAPVQLVPPAAAVPGAVRLADPAAAAPIRALPHRLWRGLPPVLRRRALSWLSALLAPHASPQAGPAGRGVVIAGELTQPSGLGEGARIMAETVAHLGVPVWKIDVPPPADVLARRSRARTRLGIPLGSGRPRSVPLLIDRRPEACLNNDPEDHPLTPPPSDIPLVIHINAPMLPWALLHLPRALRRGRCIIGYWAWELPDMPPEWRPALACVSRVWVPSRFTALALEPHLPGRVHVVPPALAIVPPRPSALGRSAFGLPEDAVVVLVSFNLASSLARKNPYAAIAAFHTAFGDRPDRILVLKVGCPDHAPEDFAKLAQLAQAPNIRLETRTLSPGDRHALTACADIVLSLHRSEGFGLVLAEAMLLGKPVIATGWSGNTEFMDPSNAVLLNYRLVPARDDRRIYRNSLWAHPDPATLWFDCANWPTMHRPASHSAGAPAPAPRSGWGQSRWRLHSAIWACQLPACSFDRAPA